MENVYLPVYRNLEKEILDLSYDIYFDDNQFEYIYKKEENAENDAQDVKIKNKCIKSPPYSLKVGELLIRCCTEIESLIQELTQGKEKEINKISSLDKNKNINVGARLIYLNYMWQLDKKIVLISCPNMFFKDKENKSFAPFCYEKEDENDYYTAYNSIKHNRNFKTIYKGNIRFLLRAMASLYLLNIYYRNQEFIVKNDKDIWEFDKSFGSSLFSVLIDETYKINTQVSSLQGNNIARCLYVAVYNDNQIENIIGKISEYNIQALKAVQSDFPEIFNNLKIEQHKTNLNIFQLGKYVGEIVIQQKISKLQNDDRNTIIEFLRNTEFYREYIKHNPNHTIGWNAEIDTIIKQISIGYYYKKLMPFASAIASISFHTSSKLILNKLCIPEVSSI